MVDGPITTPDLARLRGFGYAPGSYFNNCTGCFARFTAAKRSWRCEPCAEKAAAEWEVMTPEQQAERKVCNSKMIEDWMATNAHL